MGAGHTGEEIIQRKTKLPRAGIIRRWTLTTLGEVEREKARRKTKGEESDSKFTESEEKGKCDLVKDRLCQRRSVRGWTEGRVGFRHLVFALG